MASQLARRTDFTHCAPSRRSSQSSANSASHAGASLLRAVEGRAVGGELLDPRVGETRGVQRCDDVLGGAMKIARPPHAVQSREIFEMALGRLAGCLGSQRRRNRRIEKWWTLSERGSGSQERRR